MIEWVLIVIAVWIVLFLASMGACLMAHRGDQTDVYDDGEWYS